MIALISVVVIACEHALLFAQAKRASRERAREGPIEDRLTRTFSRDSFHSPKQYWQCRPRGYSGRYQGYAAGRLRPDSNLLSFYVPCLTKKVPFSYTFFWQMMGPFHIPGLEDYIRKHIKSTHKKTKTEIPPATYTRLISFTSIKCACYRFLSFTDRNDRFALPFHPLQLMKFLPLYINSICQKQYQYQD